MSRCKVKNSKDPRSLTLDVIRCPGCQCLVAVNSYPEHAYWCDELKQARVAHMEKSKWLRAAAHIRALAKQDLKAGP